MLMLVPGWVDTVLESVAVCRPCVSVLLLQCKDEELY